MNILGISAGFHDAAAAIVDRTGSISFAAHSERYSKVKNDAHFHPDLLETLDHYDIGCVAYYERPWLKQLRRVYSGEQIQWNKLTARQCVKHELGKILAPSTKVKSFGHHQCHAAAGFQTSSFSRATVVVIDAIGEYDTATIWGAKYNRQGHAVYKKLWSQHYPHSIGLFYSAITQRVGLTPMDEEYITMGMAAWGKPVHVDAIHNHIVDDEYDITLRQNLHTGIDLEFLKGARHEDIAASAQAVAEQLIGNIMLRAKGMQWSENLVYMGGVALNCLANRLLGKYFKNIWIMPSPGDAGSSLGAAALEFKKPINWTGPYLGHVIPGKYPVAQALTELQTKRLVGVASGAAEFGPRALGNRSLLADPRGPDIKELVNSIKRRQQFRPFAPVILEEMVDGYFVMPAGWSQCRYMQTVARCRRPDLYPAIVHVDGTSRVQTVPRDSNSGIRQLLEAWYKATGCPMLLNTSLNIRGEPMVNDRIDAERFENLYGVKVVS